MVSVFEKAQPDALIESSLKNPTEAQEQERINPTDSSTQKEDRHRTSTPVPEDQTTSRDESLTSLEANLHVASTSRKPLTELLPIHTPGIEESTNIYEQQGDETTSSLYDVPSLPGVASEVKFLTDTSERELTGENEDSQAIPALYARNPTSRRSRDRGRGRVQFQPPTFGPSWALYFIRSLPNDQTP